MDAPKRRKAARPFAKKWSKRKDSSVLLCWMNVIKKQKKKEKNKLNVT